MTPARRAVNVGEAKPCRLQLSRKKGFNLQRHSRAVNGLPTVKVDRSTAWGNPYERRSLGDASNELLVSLYKDFVEKPDYFKLPDFGELRGKNLACWCALCADHQAGKPIGTHCNACAPCHADVLLELANGFQCDAIAPRSRAAGVRVVEGE